MHERIHEFKGCQTPLHLLRSGIFLHRSLEQRLEDYNKVEEYARTLSELSPEVRAERVKKFALASAHGQELAPALSCID